MEIESANAPRVRRQVPIEIRIRTYIVLAIFLPGVYLALFNTNQPEIALLVAAILTLFFTVNHGLDWG